VPGAVAFRTSRVHGPLLMHHRFTEPTPTDRSTVELFVASWEIECCAPPPAVGESTTWRLGFSVGDDRSTPAHDRIWSVTRHETWTALSAGPVVAYWIRTDAPPPTPGLHRLRGALFGTRHGGFSPDDVPETTGTVRRVRVASEVFRLDADRTLRPIPGTLELSVTQRSPRRFSDDEHPTEQGDEARMHTGVLIELALPR
jgi:hypothetical protein